MNKNKEYKMTFKKYASPMIIRSVFNSFMYTADKMIAAIFIGASALVATTLVSPLMYFVYGISALFIGGLGAYVGLLIGKRKMEDANKIASSVILLLFLIGILMTLAIYFNSQMISQLLGAKGQILQMTNDYLKVFSLSFTFMLLGRTLDILIYNDGGTKYSFLVNILTTLMNLTLNVIAIALFDMGIIGLAFATLISNVFLALSGFYYLLFKSSQIKLVKTSIDFKKILRIVYNGLSDFSMLIVDAVMVYVVNIAFVKFLSPVHFEAYAAANILMIMFYSIFMGATSGLQPVLSQSMGAREFNYLQGLLQFAVKKAGKIGIVVYLISIPFARGILALFLTKDLQLDLGLFYYFTMGFAVLFSNYPLQVSIFFTAINRPIESSVISVARTLILIPSLVFIGIMTFGAIGLPLGFLVADLILIVCLLIYMKKVDLSKLKVLD